MNKQSAMVAAGILLAFSGAATFSQTAGADGFNPMNMMNPSKWFNNNDRWNDDRYYDRDYDRDRYGYWGGRGLGYPGYPGYVVAVQPTNKEPSRPRVPE
ncbi:Sulfur globule protein CV1 [Gammaproteobacteria bacterium]